MRLKTWVTPRYLDIKLGTDHDFKKKLGCLADNDQEALNKELQTIIG